MAADPRGPCHILIVDDSPADTHLIEAEIQRLASRTRVETAASAEEGLLKVRKTHYDLVVCDFKLPGITGLAFMKLSLDMRPDTPVVLLTGYGTEELERSVKQEGALAFIHKPLNHNVLHRIVKNALAYRQRISAA
jgi:two-component system nitrogen regulation response regulator NtrX